MEKYAFRVESMTTTYSRPLSQPDRHVKKFRYKYELDAYTVQLSFAVGDERVRLADKFAGFMADKYDLGIDRGKTKELLLKGLS